MADRLGDEGEFAEICSALDPLIEHLAEIALSELKEAIERGDHARPEAERRATRARVALERAVGILSAPTREEQDESGES